jgi:hypothetical protein
MMAKSQVKFKILLFVFTACAICLMTENLFAQAFSSSDLIGNAKQYDGKVVVYEGEVVGDVMRRGDYAWVNIFDGHNAIGAWIPWSMAKGIVFTGDYRSRGDGLEVIGIFHNSCLEHGGDLDIHVQSVRKVAAGRIIRENLNTDKKNAAALFLGVLCLVWILTQLKTR